MKFTPRVAEGRKLGASGAVRAMIDISDGLSRDLGHICRESGVGAVIFGERVPVHEDVKRLPAEDGMSPLEHALHDGEDHELLYVADERLPAELAGTWIGVTTEEKGVRLRVEGEVRPLERRGWEHEL
jgi:thiamine-monophosphate kinase